jgi:hypothetical protein
VAPPPVMTAPGLNMQGIMTGSSQTYAAAIPVHTGAGGLLASGLSGSAAGGLTTPCALYNYSFLPLPASRESVVSTPFGYTTYGTYSPGLPSALTPPACSPGFDTSGGGSCGSGGSFTGSEYSADEEVAAEVLVKLGATCLFAEAQVTDYLPASRTSVRQARTSTKGGQSRHRASGAGARRRQPAWLGQQAQDYRIQRGWGWLRASQHLSSCFCACLTKSAAAAAAAAASPCTG